MKCTVLHQCGCDHKVEDNRLHRCACGGFYKGTKWGRPIEKFKRSYSEQSESCRADT